MVRRTRVHCTCCSNRSQHTMEPDIGWVSRFMPIPPAFDAPARECVPSEYRHDVWFGKTRMVWLPDGIRFTYIHTYKWFITRTMSNKMVESEARVEGWRLKVLTEFTNVTNRQTHIQKDTARRHRQRLHSTARQVFPSISAVLSVFWKRKCSEYNNLPSLDHTAMHFSFASNIIRRLINSVWLTDAIVWWLYRIETDLNVLHFNRKQMAHKLLWPTVLLLVTCEVDCERKWQDQINIDKSFSIWIDHRWTVYTWSYATEVRPVQHSTQSTTQT